MQFVSLDCRQLLLINKAAIGMCRKGDVLENAPMEGFFAIWFCETVSLSRSTSMHTK